jgi:hypothetical protein
MDRFYSIFDGRISFVFGNCPKRVVSALVLPIAFMAMTGCTTTHLATIGEDVSPSIKSFSASPSPVPAGASTTLSWTTSKADSVIVTPGDSEPLSADGSIVLTPTESTTYTLTAINSVGSKTATATVMVDAVNANTIGSFTASPSSIGLGGSSTLSWTSAGAARVAITPGTFTSTSASGSTTVSPTATTTYKLTATNEAGGEVGTATATVNVLPGAALPVVNSFTASPTGLSAGGSSTLNWATTGATAVTISPGTFTSTSASGSTTVSPTVTTTYTLTASNAAGSVKATVTVAVQAATLPVINSFTASSASISAGGSSTLNWSTTGATGVAITPGAFASASASGSRTVSPAATATYTLTASNAAGSVKATVTVAVQAANLPLISSFTASSASISVGGSSTLNWSTTGATGVAITPGAFTSASASGSRTVSPTATSTYTLTASNAAGSVKATVTVVVQALPVINSFTASSASISVGGSSTLNWSTTGATGVAITPGAFTSASASGSRTVSPTATVTYMLTASNAAGSVNATVTVSVQAATLPVINSFAASPASINSGSSSMLSWTTTGATRVSIAPGTFTSASASGSTTVNPTSVMTYTLTATNAAGSTTATAKVTVATANGALTITTSSCPGGTQNAGYAGCTIAVSGGTPPYTFSVITSASYPPLPEGMALNASTGAISSALIGGQGTYVPELVVTDSKGAEATQTVTFSINGSNAFLENVFSSDSIFHHRVDLSTTGLPVDTSPAGPLYSGYLSSTIRPFFGSGGTFPNGIPAIEVPGNQPDVSVATTEYQSYFNSGPIPDYAPVEGTSNSTGDRHVLVYRQAGNGNSPALYEMWEGIYKQGPWTDSSNALWPDTSSDDLTTQGMGTSDAAGLPVSPLLVNADEVIGAGTPTEPEGAVRHPVRFTVNHMLKYWVWPATSTAGVGTCTSKTGGTITTQTEISQSSPPAACTMSGAAGEIYRLKASVATPACAATSPQAAIIITGFRDYGIILADNGQTGGLIGTPDARWNDADLACLESLTLGDFEPVNVSSLIVSNSSGQTSH